MATIQVSPNRNQKCPSKRETEKVLTADRRKGNHVTTEVEIAVMQPQAKESQGPPEAGRGQEWVFP